MNSKMQIRVAEFTERYGMNIDVAHRALDLASEVGELSKEILKATDYGRKNFRTNDDWEKEIGDILFSLVCTANLTGVDLDRALERVLEKYESRIARKQDAGSGK